MGTVDRILTDELGWMFTPNEVREYGIDGHAQAVRGDGLVTGRMLATQVKGGASRFRRPAADGSGWEFWSDSKHLHYWLAYHVPVLVVLVRPGGGAAFWQVIRPSTVTEHARGFTVVIPSSQRLDAQVRILWHPETRHTATDSRLFSYLELRRHAYQVGKTVIVTWAGSSA